VKELETLMTRPDPMAGVMKARWLILLVIVLTAIFFRFYKLSSSPPGLFWDEAIEGNQATSGDFRLFYTENYGREGLYVWLIAGPLRVLGNKPWVIRGVSGFFGTLTVIGFYLLISELYGWQVASIASMLLASSFWHTVVSRFGVRVVLAPCVACFAFWALVRAVRSGRLSTWIAAGFLFGLGFYTYLPFRIVPIAVLVFLLCHKGSLSAQRIAAMTAIATLTVLPLLGYFIAHPQDLTHRTSQLRIGSLDEFEHNALATALMFSVEGDNQWQHNLRGTATLPIAVGIFFMLGIAAAAWRRDVWLLSTLVLFLLPEVLSTDAPHSLRAVLAVVPVYTLAAGGMCWLWSRQKTWPYAAVIGLIVIASTITEGRKYFIDWSPRAEVAAAYVDRNINFSRWLLTLPQDKTKYVYINVRLHNAPPDMLAQAVMFATDTYTQEKQRERNLFYATDLSAIPKGAIVIPLYQ
jgi:4-amino-4-deoxy-L-arabinose transferase-like glycosyltransferase